MMFSFVISDCDSVVTVEERQRFIKSLSKQTFKDFELVLCHDGHRTKPLELITSFPITHYESEERMKVGGDNLRTPGMKLAKGKFIINGNVDNVYDPDFLEGLNKEIISNPDCEVFICPVKMMGMLTDGGFHYGNPRDYSVYHLLRGIPPVICNIDIMNLIASKRVYESLGYWNDYSNVSDGVMYELITKNYYYVQCDVLVGEHY